MWYSEFAVLLRYLTKGSKMVAVKLTVSPLVVIGSTEIAQ